MKIDLEIEILELDLHNRHYEDGTKKTFQERQRLEKERKKRSFLNNGFFC